MKGRDYHSDNGIFWDIFRNAGVFWSFSFENVWKICEQCPSGRLWTPVKFLEYCGPNLLFNNNNNKNKNKK